MLALLGVGVSRHPSGNWLHAMLSSVSGVRGAHPWAQGLSPGDRSGRASPDSPVDDSRSYRTARLVVWYGGDLLPFGCSRNVAWCLCLPPWVLCPTLGPQTLPATRRPRSSPLSLANYCKVQPGPGPESPACLCALEVFTVCSEASFTAPGPGRHCQHTARVTVQLRQGARDTACCTEGAPRFL